MALDIATRYALERRQFDAPGAEEEVLIMDYLVHQRRLFPLIAKSYALQFAQNELVAKCHELQTSETRDAEEQRELESRAAGLKAANTWHATRAIQEAREACGGAGYLAENRLIALKADTDVFTTFEGDNHVLTQLVAKELLTAYADDVKSMSPAQWVRFAANFAGERVLKRTAAQTIMQTIVDTREDNEEEGSLFNRGTQVKMFEDREEYLIASVARRLQGKSKEMSPFDAFNAVQDHVAARRDGPHRPDRPRGVRRGNRDLRGRGGPRRPRDGVRPLRAVGDRGRQGAGSSSTASCRPSAPRPSPAASTTGAASCGRTPSCSWRGSGSPSSCATRRCCTPSTSRMPTNTRSRTPSNPERGLAPPRGLEPRTCRLTVGCSAN